MNLEKDGGGGGGVDEGGGSGGGSGGGGGGNDLCTIYHLSELACVLDCGCHTLCARLITGKP